MARWPRDARGVTMGLLGGSLAASRGAAQRGARPKAKILPRRGARRVGRCLGQLVSGEDEEIRREHAQAHVRDEAAGAFPDAAVEPEGALQERDATLDPGAEGAELSVHPVALHHIE